MKKIIGIVGVKKKLAMNFSTGLDLICCPQTLIDIVNDNNAIPLVLPAIIDPADASVVMENVDALILPSGEDISPKFYNQDQTVSYDPKISGTGTPYKRPLMLAPNEERDLAELAFYKAARRKGIAVLGICRGMQLMNIAEGGTLHQELPQGEILHSIDSDGWIQYHPIDIDENSGLGKVFGTHSYIASSVHHQAIDRLAKVFNVVSRAHDGIIEMIEDPNSSAPVWGIQGHPEKIIKNYPLYLDVFKAFMEGPSMKVAH